MKKAFCLLLLAVMLLPVFALSEGTVVVYNWEDYIDDRVIALFEEETGIKVDYKNFTTNEDMIVQVEVNPGMFDVCFPSDYIVERMLQKGMLEEINFDNVPNAQYTLPNLLNPSYDPTNAYSVPYMWGTVGILYNTTMVEEPVDSWSILWDTKYQSNVFMLDSIRDSMGITLKYLGYSMNSREVPQLMEAKQKLIEQKQSGVVKAYQVDETKDKMVAGEAALALMWSGDAQYAIDLNEDLAYAVPREGSNHGHPQGREEQGECREVHQLPLPARHRPDELRVHLVLQPQHRRHRADGRRIHLQPCHEPQRGNPGRL